MTATSEDSCEKEKLTFDVIQRLKSQGLTQVEIAKKFGVTRQAVSWTYRNYGGTKTPRQEVTASFPYEVPRGMYDASVCKRLRDHGEYMVAGGGRLSDRAKQRLRSLYRRLRDNNWVVEFDPTIPPIPRVSGTHGGWRYVERTPEDGQLLIRLNSYARELSAESRRLWSFPPTEPD